MKNKTRFKIHDVICATCSKKIIGYSDQKYCSKECWKIKAFPNRKLRKCKCANCSKNFETYRTNKMFCCKKCNVSFSKYYTGTNYDVPTGTVGAIQELKVSLDLLIKGYHVFRSMSPSCPCDLAILKNKKLLTVEVRTRYRNKLGKVSYPKKNSDNPDIWAIVVGDKIIYEPIELL